MGDSDKESKRQASPIESSSSKKVKLSDKQDEEVSDPNEKQPIINLSSDESESVPLEDVNDITTISKTETDESGSETDKSDEDFDSSRAKRRRLLTEEERKERVDKDKRKAEERRIRKEKAQERKIQKEKEREQKMKEKQLEKEKRMREKEEQKKLLLEAKKKAAEEEKKQKDLEKIMKKKEEEERKLQKKKEEDERKLQKKKEEDEKRERKCKEEEEKRERKRKEEEAIESKKRRESERFLSFFQKKERPQIVTLPSCGGPFLPFEIKEGMKVAPLQRRPPLSPYTHRNLWNIVQSESYLAKLRRHVGKKIPNKVKLLQFHDNIRPPYFGTFSRESKIITGRKPFAKDTKILNYDYDSDEEWELCDGDDCEDDLNSSSSSDESTSDNETFMVDHGYLSEGEGGEPVNEGVDKELRKERLKDKAEEWKQSVEQKETKYRQLMPVLYGPTFNPPTGLPAVFILHGLVFPYEDENSTENPLKTTGAQLAS